MKYEITSEERSFFLKTLAFERTWDSILKSYWGEKFERPDFKSSMYYYAIMTRILLDGEEGRISKSALIEDIIGIAPDSVRRYLTRLERGEMIITLGTKPKFVELTESGLGALQDACKSWHKN
ncbi:MAG: hypothetical protein AAGM38_13265 [Pseudomonadota bacterium]